MATTDSPPPGDTAAPPAPKPLGERMTQPAVAIPVAVIAAFFAWVAVDRYYGTIPKPAMSEEYLKEAAIKYARLDLLSPHLLEEYAVKEQIFLYRNTALVLALAGGVFGLCFGLLAGMERDSAFATIRGALAGAVVGVASGALAGYCGSAIAEFALKHKFQPQSPAEMQRVWLHEMYTAIGVQAAQWGLVAAGLGLVVALCGHPARSLVRTVGMALVAGALASAVFIPVSSMAFPGLPSNLAIPESFWNRLLYVALPALTFTLLVTLQRKPVSRESAQ